METAARSAATPPPRAPTSPSLPTPRLLLASICLPAAALAGRLPLELDAFSALDSIYLAANSLSGPMNLELGNAPSLSTLDLVGNALSSALSTSTWNLCDRVTELRLHGNALAGAIPAPAGPNTTCDRLRVLDLSANRFSGDFPSFITAFRGLQRLDLTSNRLSGPIPNALAPEIRWKEELAQRSWRRKIREEQEATHCIRKVGTGIHSCALTLHSARPKAAKRHLTQRIEKLDDKLDLQKALSGQIRDDITDARLKLENIGSEIKNIKDLVWGLDGKIDSMEAKQDFSCAGVMYLCQFIEQNGGKLPERLESPKVSRKPFGGQKFIQGLQLAMESGIMTRAPLIRY